MTQAFVSKVFLVLSFMVACVEGAAQGADLKQVFPVGSRWKGVYEADGEKLGRLEKDPIEGEVKSVDGDLVQMEVQIRGHAVRIHHLRVQGTEMELIKNEGVGKIPGTKFAANKIEVLHSKGELKVETFSAEYTMEGASTTTGANGKLVANRRWKLTMKRQR